MVSQVETLRVVKADASARDNLVGTRVAYNQSAEKLERRSGVLGTGCEDIRSDEHADWKEWVRSVTFRYCTEPFYRGTRRPLDELPIDVNMRRKHDESGQRRITRSLSGCAHRRSTRATTQQPNPGCELPAVSRRSAVGSQHWFAALKELLNANVCVPKRRTRASLAHDVVETPSLTRAMQLEVEAALVPTPAEEVLVSAFRIGIRRADMHTLSDGKWLNDEVINFYMNLLVERSQKEGLPRVYAFNTFFFPKLISSSYDGVKRWTRAVDLFSFDIALVPLHFGNTHWCLAAIDFRTRHIAFYNSLGPSLEDQSCLKVLLDYLDCESRQRRNHALDRDSWSLKVLKVPQQENGNDCGVFVCQYAECVSRDAPISFGQRHMPYFRRRVAYEILHKTMLSA